MDQRYTGPCTFMPIHFQFPISPIPFLPHELEVEKRQFSISVELETAIVYRKFDFSINGISYSSTLCQMPRQEVDMTSYWYTDPGYSSVRQREFSSSERQCEFLVSEWQRDFSGPVGRRFFPGV